MSELLSDLGVSNRLHDNVLRQHFSQFELGGASAKPVAATAREVAGVLVQQRSLSAMSAHDIAAAVESLGTAPQFRAYAAALRSAGVSGDAVQQWLSEGRLSALLEKAGVDDELHRETIERMFSSMRFKAIAEALDPASAACVLVAESRREPAAGTSDPRIMELQHSSPPSALATALSLVTFPL
jgi:hypothetical protein